MSRGPLPFYSEAASGSISGLPREGSMLELEMDNTVPCSFCSLTYSSKGTQHADLAVLVSSPGI